MHSYLCLFAYVKNNFKFDRVYREECPYLWCPISLLYIILYDKNVGTKF
jgi:hypothetical protein